MGGRAAHSLTETACLYINAFVWGFRPLPRASTCRAGRLCYAEVDTFLIKPCNGCRVVIYRLSVSTHSLQMDQRMLVLQTTVVRLVHTFLLVSATRCPALALGSKMGVANS